MTRETVSTGLAAYLDASARRAPDRLAVVQPDGSSLTYAELNARAGALAGFLVEHGILPGDRVGVLLPKGLDAVTAIFAALKAGAAYVPVDWTAPSHRVATIFGDCGVRVVVTDGRGWCVLAGSDFKPPATILAGDRPAGAAGTAAFEEALARPPLAVSIPRDTGDLAYILYTSGSTGVPKGVMLTHGNAISFVEWCSSVFEPSDADRFSSHAPFHFDLSILDLYLAVKHAATLFLIDDELGRNPKLLARFIADRRLTVWYSTPSILALLAEHGGLDHLDCSALRLVLFAGEVFPVRHLARIAALWPRPAYYNLYGPTETNVCTFARIPTPVPPDRAEPYPIGRPCAHCAALVLDEHGEPVGRGEEGLLYIAGPSVCQGYWNRPEQNARMFLEHRETRWYNTGDIVREDPHEGFIYVGRRDRMVKRRGYRIELGDIEAGLYRHDGVREAAVVATATDSGVRILAYLVAAGDRRPSIIDLKQFCARHLPSYMIPDVFLFIDALPRTSTAKVDYQRLVQAVPEEAGR